jgi:hypothetical protein
MQSQDSRLCLRDNLGFQFAFLWFFGIAAPGQYYGGLPVTRCLHLDYFSADALRFGLVPLGGGFMFFDGVSPWKDFVAPSALPCKPCITVDALVRTEAI